MEFGTAQCRKMLSFEEGVRGRNMLEQKTNLSFLIPDSSVEFLSFQAQEVLPWLDDATFGCNGSCRVDVVPCDHANCDSCTLAFPNSFWHLRDEVKS